VCVPEYLLGANLTFLGASGQPEKRVTERRNAQRSAAPKSLVDGQCKCDADCEESCMNKIGNILCDGGNCRLENCSNRIQRPRLSKFSTDNRGFGVETNEDIRQGRIVAEYPGKRISKSDIHSVRSIRTSLRSF